jgi:hypothetical protein
MVGSRMASGRWRRRFGRGGGIEAARRVRADLAETPEAPGADARRAPPPGSPRRAGDRADDDALDELIQRAVSRIANDAVGKTPLCTVMISRLEA